MNISNAKRLSHFISPAMRQDIWRGIYRIKAWRPQIITRGRTSEKVIALTFDDGPNPTFTPQILDVLDHHQVKATFFVLGQNASEHPDILRRTTQAGHTLGNHSYSHCHWVGLTVRQIADELNRCKQAIRAAGQSPRFMRPPFGDYDRRSFYVTRALGYQLVNWTSDTHDWREVDSERIAQRVVTEARPGGIVLLHDGWPTRLDTRAESQAHVLTSDRTPTVHALPEIIGRLRDDGYRFVTLDELLHP